MISFALPQPVRVTRIKEVAHPAPRVWMHHVELQAADEIDDQLRGSLRDAYANAA